MQTEAMTEPLWAITDAKIVEAIRRIVEAACPILIIMFGSCSRGDAGRDSDLDLVIVERDVSDRYAETVRLHRVLRSLILPVDLLVIGRSDYDEWSKMPGSIYHAARRDGKVLYEAA